MGGSNNIYIGNLGVDNESLTIRLGSVQVSTFIAGIASTHMAGDSVVIEPATGLLGIAPSSAHHKQDIAAMGLRSEGVLQLRPVTFTYRNDPDRATHYGLIAEEVATVFPELVGRTPTGEPQTVRYQELIPMLLNELQRQQQELHLERSARQGQEQVLQHLQKELSDLRVLAARGRETEPFVQ